MARERQVNEEWAHYLGPVAIAQFLEVGWLRDWPLMWTRGGERAVTQHQYGTRYPSGAQKLPRVTYDKPRA